VDCGNEAYIQRSTQLSSPINDRYQYVVAYGNGNKM
jgi:hypothetical protein